MIRLIIVIFMGVICSVRSYAQEVIVDLSIEWRNEKIDFKIPPLQPKKSVPIPYLKITFRNETQGSIYFRKLHNERAGNLPSVYAPGVAINTRMDLAERVQVHFDYSGENYVVHIKQEKDAELDPDWTMKREVVQDAEDDEYLLIAGNLADIYAVLLTQNLLDKYEIEKKLSCFRRPGKSKVSFSKAHELIWEAEEAGIRSGKYTPAHYFSKPSDLTERNIANNFSDKFIFLKSKESFTQEFSLVGFYLVGGNFTFLVNDTIFNYITIGNEYEKVYLPKQVNGYKLYEGRLTSQPVKLEINHKKK